MAAPTIDKKTRYTAVLRITKDTRVRTTDPYTGDDRSPATHMRDELADLTVTAPTLEALQAAITAHAALVAE